MNFRLAKRSDITALAKLHLECGKIQPEGFMHRLGFGFFHFYYRLILEEKNSIILLAADQDGIVQGFVSGTLSSEEHLYSMKKNRLKLGFSSIPAIVQTPYLLKDLIIRNKYISTAGNSSVFGITKGPRIEYWAWKPGAKNPESAITLLESWLKIVFELDYDSIKGEVDIVNKNVLKVHKLLGAKILNEFNLKDGRRRVIIEYLKDHLRDI